MCVPHKLDTKNDKRVRMTRAGERRALLEVNFPKAFETIPYWNARTGGCGPRAGPSTATLVSI